MTNYPSLNSQPAKAGPVDLIGLAAFSVAPLLALYQGVATALGFLFVLDATTATIAPLVVISVAVAIRLPVVRQRLASPSIRRATLYLLGYLLVILASTLLVYLDPVEGDPVKMMQQFAGTAIPCLIFFVMIGAPSLKAAMRSLGLSLLVWAAAAILTPLSALTPLAIGEVQGAYAGSQGVRSFGVLGDGGTFVVSFLAVAFFSTRRFVWFSLALVALVIAGSRSPLIVAAVGIGMSIVLATPGAARQRPGSRAIRVVIASGVAASLLVAIQAVFGALSQRLGANNALERISDTQFTETDRFFSIAQGLEWFELSPIYGNGFNAYYFFSLRSGAFGANQSNALNQIVQTLVDGGVLALTFLVLFFFEALRPGQGTMVDRRTDPYGLRIWLVVFLILNQTAVYIGLASSLTILVFGMTGIVLFLREMNARAPVPRKQMRAPIPLPNR